MRKWLYNDIPLYRAMVYRNSVGQFTAGPYGWRGRKLGVNLKRGDSEGDTLVIRDVSQQSFYPPVVHLGGRLRFLTVLESIQDFLSCLFNQVLLKGQVKF